MVKEHYKHDLAHWLLLPDLILLWFIFSLPMLIFPLSNYVIVMHPDLIAGHHLVEVSQIICSEIQKFWNTFYRFTFDCFWAFAVPRSRPLTLSAASLWEYDGLSSEVWYRRASRDLVNKLRSLSIIARAVLMFISVIDVCGWPPFFSYSGTSFRFFENVECHLYIVDSARHSNLYASLNNFIFSTNLQRQIQIWC